MSVLDPDSIDEVVIRRELALVRALADEVERRLPGEAQSAAHAQLVEELFRLGYRLIDTASTMLRNTEATRDGTPRSEVA